MGKDKRTFSKARLCFLSHSLLGLMVSFFFSLFFKINRYLELGGRITGND